MPIIELYSKRRNKERNGAVDVYQYDSLPGPFRIQLSMMIAELLGTIDDLHSNDAPKKCYQTAVTVLRKEYGMQSLGDRFHASSYEELHWFLLNEHDTERCLDAVELSYKLGQRFARDGYYIWRHRDTPGERVDDCIDELNGRFKEAGCGFAFVDDEIIRIDSGLLHSEVVKPAIHFLNANGYEAAREEFFGAYEHYRHGNHKEALVDAAKAFESTIKVICIANGWPYKPEDTANKLIQILVDKGFLPSFHQTQLSSIQAVLSSGIPTLRNKQAAHGDGPDVVEVAPEVVAYGLHLTASAIVMLATAQMKRSTS